MTTIWLRYAFLTTDGVLRAAPRFLRWFFAALLSAPIPLAMADERNELNGAIGAASVVIEFDCFKDTDDSWLAVGRFIESDTDSTRQGAFRILDEKLRDWSSHPAAVIDSIISGIEEHRIEAGRDYLVQFLHVDLEQGGAISIANSAAFALGELGGHGAFVELTRLSQHSPPDLRPAVALALGLLGDHRAIGTIEDMARSGDARLRDNALSALARFCSTSSKPLVIQSLDDAAASVRNSATWWFAQCGEPGDDSYLVQRLRDSDSLVRGNALKGLTRLRSRLGCDALPVLLADDLNVRAAAEAYQSICTGQ